MLSRLLDCRPAAAVPVVCRGGKWWNRLRTWWRLARRLPSEQQFVDGRPIDCGGLLFSLDPHDATLVHIAIPLDTFDRDEVPDMVREATEWFREFAQERPAVDELVRDRVLVIRVIHSYERLEEEIGERIRVEDWHPAVEGRAG